MKSNSFLSYKIDPKKIDKDFESFESLTFEDQKKFLLACLEKNELFVNYDNIKDSLYKIDKSEIKINELFYGGIIQ